MALFDRTAKHLARGPAVLFPADPADAMADAVLRYDPATGVKSDRFVFRNDVELHGPVVVTPDVARQAGLPSGLATGYYATIVDSGTSRSRPDSLKWQDAERLIRGLAARLGGTVHDEQPPMDLRLRAVVYSVQSSLPAEQVIGVLQPYVRSGALVIEKDTNVPDAYYLITEQEPVFFVAYWPPRLSRSKLALPPPALGDLSEKEPCRWDLRTKLPMATATREACLLVAEAAVALAGRADGTVIDAYGFPVDRPEDMLPG
ncbi:MAG: hypothetical protein J2P30_23310 [Actinobacteria bacterium]|nr:hypothetical protein [Actinomycetota bacterium]